MIEYLYVQLFSGWRFWLWFGLGALAGYYLYNKFLRYLDKRLADRTLEERKIEVEILDLFQKQLEARLDSYKGRPIPSLKVVRHHPLLVVLLQKYLDYDKITGYISVEIQANAVNETFLLFKVLSTRSRDGVSQEKVEDSITLGFDEISSAVDQSIILFFDFDPWQKS